VHVTGKPRIAPPMRLKTPSQIMMERYEKLQQQKLDLEKKLNSCQNKMAVPAPNSVKRKISSSGGPDGDMAIYTPGEWRTHCKHFLLL